jgi:hypothetical protein
VELGTLEKNDGFQADASQLRLFLKSLGGHGPDPSSTISKYADAQTLSAAHGHKAILGPWTSPQGKA